MRKELGKISDVYFGLGGYQDACIGINLSFTTGNSGVSASKTAWDAELIKHSEHCEWSEESRNAEYAEIVRFISKLLADAKVIKVADLLNVPVEITVENNTLKDWRILTEVL